MYGQQQKTIRKFYRFNVNSPMNIKALAKRGGGDASIFVSISATNTTSDSITIHEYEFQPPYGLVAEKIESAKENDVDNNQNRSAVQMYDVCGILKPGSTRRYLFLIKTSTQDALLRGIAVGDVLGHAVFSWKKGMGESVGQSCIWLFAVNVLRLTLHLFNKLGSDCICNCTLSIL